MLSVLWHCTPRIDVLTEIGWPAIIAHDSRIGLLLRNGLASIPGVHVLGRIWVPRPFLS